jgi:uncharacterized membrane protein YeiH
MNILYILDLFGTLVFSISGVLVSSNKHKFDIFGTSVIGFVTAIGGGTLRDVMIGNTPVSWIRDINYFYAIIIGIILTYIFKDKFLKLKKTLSIFDTIGLSAFTILGVQTSLNNDITPIISIIFGVVSAVFGGIIRDILSNEQPIIFKRDFYASSAIIGATIYNFLLYTNLNYLNITFISIFSIIIIRLLSIKNKWRLPII